MNCHHYQQIQFSVLEKKQTFAVISSFCWLPKMDEAHSRLPVLWAWNFYFQNDFGNGRLFFWILVLYGYLFFLESKRDNKYTV